MGGSGTEADTLLTFLALPHGSSFKSTTFHQLKDKIGYNIRNLAEKEIENALQEEVKLQLVSEGRGKDFDKWKDGEKIATVKLTVMYDMGWNKRSSGHRYDSRSAHAMLVGGHTRKVIGMKVMSKECTKCDGTKKHGKEPEEHACPKNFQGSSKSMEVQAIYEMTVDAWDNRGFAIGTIVSDDDTTMKSHLKHSYQELIKAGQMKKEEWPLTKSGNKTADSGRLPLHVKVSPKFLADPNHCKKVVGKYLYALAAQQKIQEKWIKLFPFVFVTILVP